MKNLFLHFQEMEEGRNNVPLGLRHLLLAGAKIRFREDVRGWILEQYLSLGSIYVAKVHYSLVSDETLCILSNIDALAICRSTRHEVFIPANELITVGNEDASITEIYVVKKGNNYSYIPGVGLQEIFFITIPASAIARLSEVYSELKLLTSLLHIGKTQKLDCITHKSNQVSKWLEKKLLGQVILPNPSIYYLRRIAVSLYACVLRCTNHDYSRSLTKEEETLADEALEILLQNMNADDPQSLLSRKLGTSYEYILYTFKNRFKISIMNYIRLAQNIEAYEKLSLSNLSIATIADLTRVGLGKSGEFHIDLFKIRMEKFFGIPITIIRPNI
ncbi:hypothetical protein ACE38W_12690 [Chitinophaga sp. Hz27]|uniref:hypothetical protein n=1 Tax=Chitinophaga sp. Hz27 TaxID=3347169 RepID=UPI0035D96768